MMKILLTTLATNIDAKIDPRFGRGAILLVVNPKTLEWSAEPNPAIQSSGGAGIQAAQYAASNNCSAVISGEFGPNAYNSLAAAGIRMYLYGSCKTAREAILRYQSGDLDTPAEPVGEGYKNHPTR